MRERQEERRRVHVDRGTQRVGNPTQLVGVHDAVLRHVRRNRREDGARALVLREEEEHVRQIVALFMKDRNRAYLFDLLYESGQLDLVVLEQLENGGRNN